MMATRSDPHARGAKDDAMTLDTVREFQRRMASMIEAVQAGIWEAGVHDLVGYATDYAFGQQRGVQTLVLKTNHRSSYLRLHWDTIMGDAPADLLAVEKAVRNAIDELR